MRSIQSVRIEGNNNAVNKILAVIIRNLLPVLFYGLAHNNVITMLICLRKIFQKFINAHPPWMFIFISLWILKNILCEFGKIKVLKSFATKWIHMYEKKREQEKASSAVQFSDLIQFKHLLLLHSSSLFMFDRISHVFFPHLHLRRLRNFSLHIQYIFASTFIIKYIKTICSVRKHT